MLRYGLILSLVAGLVAFGCGGADQQDFNMEDAVMTAALSEGDGEDLGGVPEGDAEDGADEMVDDVMDEEPLLTGDCSLEGIRQRLIAHYDQDGDGHLDRGELADLRQDFGPFPRFRVRWARHHRWMRLKWVYDADESGTLSEQERQQLRDDLQARCQARREQMLENFDANGDGMLDADEWQAARDALQARRQARRQEILEQYDENQNGQLDPIERSALRTDIRTRILERRQELKEQFDADDSGDLDAQERAALREAIRSRIRGEHFGEDGSF